MQDRDNPTRLGRSTPRLAMNGLQARLVGRTPALQGHERECTHPSQIRIRCGAVHENASLPTAPAEREWRKEAYYH
jgi:hypothetical protein